MAYGVVFFSSLLGIAARQAVQKFRAASGLRGRKTPAAFADCSGEKPVRAGLLLPLSAKIARKVAQRRRFR